MPLDIEKELAEAGAVYTDMHFVYASGKHGSGYINMDPLFTNTKLMWHLGVELWGPFISDALFFDTVAAPATGGIALAYATAFSLKHEIDVGSGGPIVDVVWADKDGGDFVFERAGFINHVRDKRVLIVEDLLTTGGSVAKVVHEVERGGGNVIGVSAVCNRGGITAESLGVPRLESLLNVSFEAVAPESCPLCASEVPIVADIGHGADHKTGHPDYAGGYRTLLT